MKAIRIHEFGGLEQLRLEEAPDPPSPKEGEVLVRVKAVGVNFADHLMRIGAYAAGKPPIIPGLEAAGVVEALGPGPHAGPAASLQPGDRVLSWGRRTYAELAPAPDWAVARAPEGLSWEELAAIPAAFGTAWHALISTARLELGERVLVHAAGSGIGSAAIQVAKAHGAWVLATAGQSWKLERARDLGADAVVNYSTEDLATRVELITEGKGLDVVLEGVGKATFAAGVRSLTAGGRMVIYGSPSGPRVELDTREAISRNLTFYGMSITTSPRFPATVAAFVRDGLPMFADGRLKPVIDQVYPFSQAAEAHQRMMDRAQFGKLVLGVSD